MVLVNVSLVNVPGAVDIPTVNSFALEIPVTWNVPLNPVFAVPAECVELCMLISSTLELTDKSCGN